MWYDDYHAFDEFRAIYAQTMVGLLMLALRRETLGKTSDQALYDVRAIQ